MTVPTSADVDADPRVAAVATQTDIAQAALTELQSRYPLCAPADATVVVALGGDGFMLETLHRFMHTDVAIYGMHRGSVGFLMNVYEPDGLFDRIRSAERVGLHPLAMIATCRDGTVHTAPAVNEVALLRETGQMAKIRISVDGVVRMAELMCDGVMVATPAGSTAYNLSAHGPIIPLSAGTLALTPISAFRPRRWRGALLNRSAHVTFEIMEETKRPVSAGADQTEIRDVVRVDIREDLSVTLNVLFDAGNAFEERVLKEQFLS